MEERRIITKRIAPMRTRKRRDYDRLVVECQQGNTECHAHIRR